MKVHLRLTLVVVLGLACLAQPTLAQTQNAGDGPYMTVNPTARIDGFTERARQILTKYQHELRQNTRFGSRCGLWGRPDSVAEQAMALNHDLATQANYDNDALRNRWNALRGIVDKVVSSLDQLGDGMSTDPKTHELYFPSGGKSRQSLDKWISKQLATLPAVSTHHSVEHLAVHKSPDLKAVARKAEKIRQSYLNALNHKEECVPGMEEVTPQMLLAEQIESIKGNRNYGRAVTLLAQMKSIYRRNVEIADVGKKKENLHQVDRLIAQLEKA